MKGLLFVPLLFALGYLLGDGDYGSKMINGFEWLNMLYLIMIWIVSIIMIVFTLVIAVGGSSSRNRISGLSAGFGIGVGLLIWVFAVAMTYFNYWITSEIIINTVATATEWSELGSTDLIFIYAIIFVVSIFVSKNKKSD